MKNNENIFVLSGILFAITAVVALLLAFSNNITDPIITENSIKEQNQARMDVMPNATDFIKVEKEFDGVVKEVYEAKKDGMTVGYCVSVAPVGYGGEINMMVGVGADKITTLKVVSLSETPGLGSKASEESFQNQFNDKSTNKAIKVIKNGTAKEDEVVAISGATITTDAVTKGVNAAIDAIKHYDKGVGK